MQQRFAVVDNACAMTPPLVSELDPSELDRAFAGDPAALTRLYLRYQPIVLHAAKSVLCRWRATDAAPELAAEVWLRLLERGLFRAFDPERGGFDGFMRMVAWQQALRIAAGWFRRREREPIMARAELPEVSCASEVDRFDQRQFLSRMLLTVSPPLDDFDRVLLQELYVNQRSACQLASRLGRSPSSVHKRNQRLRARLVRAANQIDREPLGRAA